MSVYLHEIHESREDVSCWRVLRKMRSLGRSSSPRKLLVLALVVCVVVGELGLTINAAKFLKHKEFERSMARYRHLLQAEHESRQDASQENLEEQEPEKHVEKFRGEEQQVIRHEKNLINDVATKTPEDLQQLHEKVEEEWDEKKGDETLNENTADQQQLENKSEEERDEINSDETLNETTNDQQEFEAKSEEERDEINSDETPNESTNDQQQVEAKSEEERDEINSDETPDESTNDQQQFEAKSEEERDETNSDETPNESTNDQQQVEAKSEEERDETNSDETPNESTNDQQQFEAKSEEEQPEEKKTDELPNETTADQQHFEENPEIEQPEENKIAEIPGNESPVEEQNPPDEPFVQPKDAYIFRPSVTDWDQQRARWLDHNPNLKSTGRPRVLIITGSQPHPCRTRLGGSFHLKSLKNKIDYARMHKYEIFYNFAFLDPLFTEVWVKLPIIRNLMLTHPEIEWILWMDADAIFTDMLFEPSLESFEGSNLVMWAIEVGLFTEKRWLSTNDGVFYIRNCQWSLDLLDKWSPMGPVGDVRNEYGKLLSSFFTDRDTHKPADDQSALAYLIITDETVSSKVKLIEESQFKMSSYWPTVVHKFEMYAEKYHPGLGDERWPWVTHFTGCAPCGGGNDPQYSFDMCIDSFNRAFHFGDNQVLAYLGLQHSSLESYDIVKTRNETDRPVIEWVGVNPWAARIAQVAAGETDGQTSDS